MSELLEAPAVAEDLTATWCVQIFAVPDVTAARAAEDVLRDLLDGTGSVQVSSSGPDHFVVVETSDDPLVLDLVATSIGSHVDHAELVHRSSAASRARPEVG